MFQRVTEAIREVDKRHILFLETSIASNMGVYSAIEPVKGPDSGRDPLQVYAPHAYDLVTDTPDIASPSNPRVEFILTRHGETGKRLGMPVLVGEWGAYGGSAGAQPAAEFVVRQFEKLLCGETYWAYSKDLAKTAAFRALQRAYPMAVAGTLLEYRADASNRKFTCAWREDPKITAPTRIYFPEKFQITKDRVNVTPPGEGFNLEPVREGSHNTYLVIRPTGKAVERRLSVN
jgi:endoglycosylceramidase